MSTQFTNRQWRLPNNENKDKQSNYSMDFDGTSGVYIIAGDNSSLGEGYTGYTISAWAKTPSSWESDYNAILTKKYSFYFGLNQNHYLILNPGSGTSFRGYEVTSTTVLNLDTWYHFLVTADGTNVKLYINGSLDKTQAETNTAQNSNTTYAPYIGAYSNSGDFDTWKGQFDAICFFNYALSSSQVTTLYGSSSTGIGNPMSLSPKPVAYYPLGDQDAFNGADYLVPNSSLKDYVFDFDGSNDYIDTNSTFNTLTSFTVSAWFKADDAAGTVRSIVSTRVNGITTSKGFDIYISANVLTARVYNNGATEVTQAFTDTSNWHNVVMTYNGTTLELFLDNSSTGTATGNYDNSGGRNLTIGKWGPVIGASYYFDGLISNVSIFNTALSTPNIETLYNNGSPLTSMSGFTSLQGWWKLNASDTYDGTNWTIEDHAGSNDGTSSGMSQANLVQSDLSFTSGYSPYALEFDGTNDYIDTNTNLNSLGVVNTFSISLWVKIATNGNYDHIIGAPTSYSAWNTGFGLYTNTTGVRFWVDQWGPSGNTFVNSASLSLNVWYHIAATFDTTNGLKLYVNAGTPTTATGNGILDGLTNDIYIASTGTNTNYAFNGSISNVSIWNTELTSAQVTEIYNEGVPSNLNNHSAYSNLVSWWQLGSNSSFNTNWTVLDEKGSNNGTSVNMGEDAIVDGVGSYANGLSSGMGGDEVIGDAPYSTANALSVNMDVEDRVEDTPS